jgi:DNA polymerase III delta subunit
MTLQKLKEDIENKTFKPTTMILVSEDKFIPLMYIEEISKSFDYTIRYIQSLSEIDSDTNDIFGDSGEHSSDLIIYNTDVVNFSEEVLYNQDNIIVVTNKIDKGSKKFYGDLVVEIPKLEEWQIKDMVYSFMEGVDTKHLDWLIHTCGGNVHRLYQESLKVRLFRESERKSVFDEMVEDGAFDDLSSNTIFNFTNAILKKDIKSLKIIYEEIDNIDINDFGLLTILYNNFLNVINIQLGINPTPESVGMKPNQFNAVRYNCGHYNSKQLIGIFRLLTDIDRRVKSGEFPTNIMRDYLILSILSQI